MITFQMNTIPMMTYLLSTRRLMASQKFEFRKLDKKDFDNEEPAKGQASSKRSLLI